MTYDTADKMRSRTIQRSALNVAHEFAGAAAKHYRGPTHFIAAGLIIVRSVRSSLGCLDVLASKHGPVDTRVLLRHPTVSSTAAVLKEQTHTVVFTVALPDLAAEP